METAPRRPQFVLTCGKCRALAQMLDDERARSQLLERALADAREVSRAGWRHTFSPPRETAR